MTLSEHEEHVLRDLEASLDPDLKPVRSGRAWSNDPHHKVVAVVMLGLGVLAGFTVTALALALPSPVNIWASVACYLATVALSTELVILCRRRLNGHGPDGPGNGKRS